jgi:enamine deaminase RidA (YjgF/YER057c/UK114 family)
MLKEISLISRPSDATSAMSHFHTLGALIFSKHPAAGMPPELAQAMHLHVPMPRLDSEEAACEVFGSDAAIVRGQLGSVTYSHDGSVLFGILTIPEEEAPVAGVPPLQAATFRAYSDIFKVLDETGYDSVLRFWNYMAGINVDTHGLERYRQFNLGRQEAFAKPGSVGKGTIPAACALGFESGPLTIAFLAGKGKSIPIENPRQVSAYRYPAQYGPRSPLFSRATLAVMDDAEVLFLSGTASILGHETLHEGDVLRQTRETLVNIEAVLAEANKRAKRSRFDLSSMLYTVYIRRSEDVAVVRAELERAVGPDLHAVYLQADICRQDLLLEIEAVSDLKASANRP